MYTNIDTVHALQEIEHFLCHSRPDICFTENLDVAAIMMALHIIMYHNVFKFGDTFWVQLTGTAMGSPPAPMYATLYYAIHKVKILQNFPELHFYHCYIDDGLGIWITSSYASLNSTSICTWELFQEAINN